MRGIITDYNYISGGEPELKQGVKGGRVPKNAVRGGNGSFIVAEPAKIFLGVSFDNGTYKEYEVGDHFRRYLHHEGIARVTQKRVKNICGQLLNREARVSEDGSVILNLEFLLNCVEI